MNNNVVVIPYAIDFNKWASQMVFIRPDLQLPIPPPNGEDWRPWANYVYFNSSNVYPYIPYASKEIYPNHEDWRTWAAQMVYQLISL